MTPEYRRELRKLLAKNEQLICEWEAVMVDPQDDLEPKVASKTLGQAAGSAGQD